MPHNSIKLIPGVDQNRTPALNEAAVSECNRIRFMFDRQGVGLIQKLGGWLKFYANSIGSIVRALHAWQTLNNVEYLAAGAEQSLNVIYNGNLKTISPQELLVNPPVDVSTTAGSSDVIIRDVGSAVDNYDSVYIETQITVGGLRLQGLYQCRTASSNTYIITSIDALGAPLPATSTVSNGGSVASFTTTNGSYTVNVLLSAHGYAVGDTATFLVSTEVGGVTIYGNYIVNNVIDANHFEINADATATSTETNIINAGFARYLYFHGIGPVAAGSGFGIGGFGMGGFGSGVAPITSRTCTTIGTKGTGTVATISHSTNTEIPIGSYVTVAGVTPLGYNGFYQVTDSSSLVVDVDGASGTGTTATLTFEESTVITVGTVIIVAGVTPAGYNGTHVVTASSAGSVSFASATTGPLTVVGTLEWNTVSFASTTTGAQTVAGTITISNIPGIGATDWSLQNWGEILIASPVNGPIFQYQPSSGTPVATVISQAPVVNDGMLILMPQRQILAWGSTFTGIKDPLLLRWCDVSDYTSWIAKITNQAGSFRLSNGSKVVGCIQGPQQVYVMTDLGVWAGQYVGQPYVWQFNEVATGCGLISRRAVTSMGGVIYWMGQSQFYKMGTDGWMPIPCPVWDVIFQDLDTSNYDKIRACGNSRFSEVSWSYPTVSGGGEVTNYVKYNTALNTWDYGFLNITAWINQSVLGPPIGALSDSYIYQFETSTDAAGQPMNSWFQTGMFTLNEGDLFTFIDQFWPDAKWGYYGGTQNANLLLTFYVYAYPGDDPVVEGPFTLTEATTYITPRLRGRLISIKFESNDTGTFWRMGNMRYRWQADGKF